MHYSLYLHRKGSATRNAFPCHIIIIIAVVIMIATRRTTKRTSTEKAMASCLILVKYDIEREMSKLSIYILLHYNNDNQGYKLQFTQVYGINIYVMFCYIERGIGQLWYIPYYISRTIDQISQNIVSVDGQKIAMRIYDYIFHMCSSYSLWPHFTVVWKLILHLVQGKNWSSWFNNQRLWVLLMVPIEYHQPRLVYCHQSIIF